HLVLDALWLPYVLCVALVEFVRRIVVHGEMRHFRVPRVHGRGELFGRQIHRRDVRGVAGRGERGVVRVRARAVLAGVRIAGPVHDRAVDAAVPQVVRGGIGLARVAWAVSDVRVADRAAEAEVGAALESGQRLAVHGDRAATTAVAEPQLRLGDHLGARL